MVAYKLCGYEIDTLRSELVFIRQLTTSSVYVFAAAAAEAGIDAVLVEVLHELLDSVFFGFCEEGLFDGVVFDDVHEVGGYLAEEFDEFFGILAAIVEVFEEDVFEGDLVSCLLVEIVQRIDEGLDVVGLVDGHDLIALRVVGGMEGDGEFEFDLIVAELPDHFGHAGCRYGDAAGAHGQAVFGRDAFDGMEDVLIVE